jgi:hypothetical protein
LFKKHGFFLIAISRSGKKSLLCALCASSEAGGECILTYLHSKAGTISIAEGLID